MVHADIMIGAHTESHSLTQISVCYMTGLPMIKVKNSLRIHHNFLFCKSF